MSFPQRTLDCGLVRPEHAGQSVILNGWAHRVRNLGGLFFVDLRDRTGIVQVVFDPNKFGETGGSKVEGRSTKDEASKVEGRRSKADPVEEVASPAEIDLRPSSFDLSQIKPESCLAVVGTVRPRSAETVNPKMGTGEVEVSAESFEILGPAKTLPFPVSDEEQMSLVNEELRIKYRYIDLRRPSMYRKLAIRAEIVRLIRAFLDTRGFLEIETPIITKSTPEGARDYLVPYRIEAGKFYALPQSPQQYKQLLMVAGIERYYQIPKCFRDEAQRADRQPEFTQLDLEMSFVTQEDVLQLAEELTRSVCNAVIEKFKLEKGPVEAFPRLTYTEAMQRFGTDKPDLRFGLELFDITDVAKDCGFEVFKKVAQSGGSVRGVRYAGGASLSRKEIGELEELAKSVGAKGLATMSVSDGEGAVETPTGWKMRGGVVKFFKPEELEIIRDRSDAENGDLLLFAADKYLAGNAVLARLRNEIGKRRGLADPKKLIFCWVLDFPLLEWDEEAKRWSSTHHPFTGPKPEHLHLLESDPGKVLADCYDIVCNGVEWASGSIRIHRPDVQARVFKMLGIDEKAQKERFGHMLEAFQLGAPPHGGIAPGIDRLAMLLADEENIREVIAFPKIAQGVDPMMGAPSEIDPEQWEELGLTLTPKKSEK